MKPATRCSDWQVLQEIAYDAAGRRVQTVEYVDPATGAQLPAEKVTRHVYRGIEAISASHLGGVRDMASRRVYPGALLRSGVLREQKRGVNAPGSFSRSRPFALSRSSSVTV